MVFIRSLDLELIQPENILQAVASVDTFYVDSARPADSQAQGTFIPCHHTRSHWNHLTSSVETPLPDMVPNTFPGEPSIAPPIPPSATSISPTTSEQPPAAVASLPGLPAPVPEVIGVPIPRKVWTSPFPVFFCS
jgi:hypothetical protein